MREAVLWEREGDRVVCGLCPHRCHIAPDHRGACGARGNEDGTLIPLTYGRVSSAAADPIEKKPVFHYRPGTLVFSLGALGCTMRCRHCQNIGISTYPTPASIANAAFLPPEHVPRFAHETGCTGVAFTYNEPIASIEYVIDAGLEAKRAGLFVVMVTNGYITPEGLDLLRGIVDVWRVDIKGFAEETYRTLCRVSHAEVVREQAVRAQREHGMHVECVTNVVPGVNDSDQELRSIARWIASELGPRTPWHVTRFIPHHEMIDRDATPLDTLRHAVSVGREEGLEFVYLGNVPGAGDEDTVCPGCGTVVISRRGHAARVVALADGACAECGMHLGIVEAT